jgi:hypothetical protein
VVGKITDGCRFPVRSPLMGTRRIDRTSYSVPYMDNFLWDGVVMPKLPQDGYQQDAAGQWGAVGHFPAQPAYREARDARRTEPALSWSELDRLPAGASTRRGLTAR